MARSRLENGILKVKERKNRDERMLNRVTRYLSFLEFARRRGGAFHNFMSYQRHWLDAEGCGDCQGQAVRALAKTKAGGILVVRLAQQEKLPAELKDAAGAALHQSNVKEVKDVAAKLFLP